MNKKGQIVKIISDMHVVNYEDNIYECKCRGKFRNQNITPLVGDNVIFDDEKNFILEVLPRKNSFIRPAVSNIDQAFIITSLKQPDFSTNLLDKLLVLMEHNNVLPIICLTKKDLLTKDEYREIKKIIKYYKKLGYIIVDNTKINKIKKMFKNKTSVFTGQTGAGKSTLLNKLNKSLDLKTGEISKALGRGKHTTRHVELIEMLDGKVSDTPGFSSLDFTDLSNEDIKNGFREFRNNICPFRDCMHIDEKECVIKKRIKEGKILQERYDTYKKLLQK